MKERKELNKLFPQIRMLLNGQKKIHKQRLVIPAIVQVDPSHQQQQQQQQQQSWIARGVTTNSARTSSSSSDLTMIFGRGGGGGSSNNNDDETFIPGKKMNMGRRKKLGINDDEEEYDLEMALNNSTDPFITKVIAGSLIISITTLLIYAIVIPATTDYGDGVCNALLTGGRC
mmetsp:Transcript_48061/g.55481  ORF Transcript_48061/g.55481 Transcript_48061/m.55481 type:complete len:173 (+) Transcript_48061:461-979(+)